MTRRLAIAVSVLLLWLGGIAMLVRREMFQSETERLVRAALLVAPGAYYYAVTQEGRPIGFASSSIDTVAQGIQITDILAADLIADGATRRANARVTVSLSRGLRLRGFSVDAGGGIGPLSARGTVSGDSVLTVVRRAGTAPAATERVRLTRPLLLPTVVPLVIALGTSPAAGNSYQFSLFDPISLTSRDVTVRVRAESVFVLTDSAAFDANKELWVPARQDTVRAWRIEQDGGGLVSGWVDDKGRPVDASPMAGITVRRTAYEIAHENWTRTRGRRSDLTAAAGLVTPR